MQNHLKDECQIVMGLCPNEGCNEVFIKSQLDDHVQKCHHSSNQLSKQDMSNSHGFAASRKSAPQQCNFNFLGCHFVGNNVELAKHMEKGTCSHLEYVCKFLASSAHLFHNPNDHVSSDESNAAMKKLLFTDIEKVKAFFQ